ncbi:GNAT family N-acetyltransferase [Clostridium nigeriense]|uniref:GNAT family N-acetyltransferase n=1 Tax=Clostridium nigeriense TaxID=1805470 RepID=UPI003D34DDA5
MKIKIYDTVQGFLNENEELLLEKESVTQLILHNAFVNKEKETNKEVIFGRIEDEEDNIKLIFANVKPYNLLIYNLDNDTLDSVKSLANYLIKDKIALKGINANKKICNEFTEYFEYKTGCTFKEYLAMDIMEITELNKELVLPKGNFRVATLEDKDILIDWNIKFAKEALDEEISYEEFKDKLDERIKNKSIYIFEDEKHRPMAMIAATRQLVNGVSVSLVYSSEETRGKGYGLAIVYNLSKDYLSRGNKFCSLFVDKKNPISNGVYKKIGYKILEDNYDYRIV